MVYKSRLMPVALAVTMGIALLLMACGGGDDNDNGAGAGNGGGAGPVTLDMAFDDASFVPDSYTVSKGADVTFNISNNGAAIHNARVAGADNEFDSNDDAVSEPDLIPGGESGSLTWKAPGESGEFSVRCDYHPTITATIAVE